MRKGKEKIQRRSLSPACGTCAPRGEWTGLQSGNPVHTPRECISTKENKAGCGIWKMRRPALSAFYRACKIPGRVPPRCCATEAFALSGSIASWDATTPISRLTHFKEPKQAGCGRGVGREKEAHSPPGLANGRKTGGECRVYERGIPRRKSQSKLAADGEWDARRKHTPRPV